MPSLWYYTKQGSSEKVGPITEGEFHRLVQQGLVAPNDLVWTDGMSDWATLGSLPQLAPTARSATTAGPAVVMSAVPTGLVGWMTFVAVVHIVMGILSILTCFGFVTGILMLLSGTALLGAKAALQTNLLDATTFLMKLRTFMQMMGMVYIFSIVGFLLGLVFFFQTFASALSQVLQTTP